MAVKWWQLIPLLVLTACNDAQQQADVVDDPVVARVNGEEIRASEVSAAWNRTFAEQDMLFDGAELQQRLLQSLVASRVMARQAEAAMSDEQRQELDQLTRAWREEQLVKRYLADHVVAEPVDQQMVEDYYNKHPELFGGGQRYEFEQLKVVYGDDSIQRDKALDLFALAGEAGDWAAFARTNSGSGLVLVHQRVVADAGFADKTLLATLSSLSPGQLSPVTSGEGAVAVVRLNRREAVAPRPLAEVSSDIRQRLAPVKLRQAVKQAMDGALSGANIEYVVKD